MSKDSINHKIRNEVQEAIAGISANNPAEKYALLERSWLIIIALDSDNIITSRE